MIVDISMALEKSPRQVIMTKSSWPKILAVNPDRQFCRQGCRQREGIERVTLKMKPIVLPLCHKQLRLGRSVIEEHFVAVNTGRPEDDLRGPRGRGRGFGLVFCSL